MIDLRVFRRSALLAVSLLSACAASNVPSPTGSAAAGPAARKPSVSRGPSTGAYGEFLAGRAALSRLDLDQAADFFLQAMAADPANPELAQQAFVACVMAGRPEAARLARGLPDNQVAQLMLADADARAGNWAQAETRYHALPRQGLTQLLQPLLVAWAQQGAGHTDAALGTLQPYVDGQRFRAVYALHAALIADLANRPEVAARNYRTAQTETGALNLRLAQILASWQARTGHEAEAMRTLRALTESGDELAIVLPALLTASSRRPVARPTDGIAEAYLALAAALRQQDANDFTVILLRLALEIRPDFTAAKLLLAEALDGGKHPEAAAKVLASVPADDPLSALTRLRLAAAQERMGKSEEAARSLEQLARDYPDRPEPLALLGDIQRSKSRFADAVAAYDRAVARIPQPGPSDWALLYDRGIALDRSGQWARAEADFQHALELSPEQPYVLNYLAYSWTERDRNLGRAKAMIERAVELRPNDGSIIDSLGWVMLRQGDTAGAVKQLERAVELQTEDATINGHLGDAYWAAGRRQEARFQWRRALTLKPEPEEAARLEAKLRDGAAVAGPVNPGIQVR